VPTSRAQFKKLAEARLREANILLTSREWSGAYYLSGYAVEFGLKAAIARRFKASTMPDKTYVQKIHTHNLQDLVKLAELEGQQQQDFQGNQALEDNWLVAKDWSETSRYATWTRSDAQDMVSAISADPHGVMKWVESIW
jgi:HEPN domain-containing protein